MKENIKIFISSRICHIYLGTGQNEDMPIAAYFLNRIVSSNTHLCICEYLSSDDCSMLKRTDHWNEAGEKEYSMVHKEVVVYVLKFPLTSEGGQEKHYLAENHRELLSIRNKLITFAEWNEVWLQGSLK